MNPLLVPTLSLFATVSIGLLMVRKAAVWGLVDLPNERKVHTQPTPRTGGLAMIIGIGSVYALMRAIGWVPTSSIPWQSWLSGIGFIFVGALDDHFGFHPRQKISVFLGLSVIAAWPWAHIVTTTGFVWIPPTWVGSRTLFITSTVLLTLWFMAVTNSVNIEDAINGYMGGFTFITLAALYVRGVDSSITLGALLGFLILNWPKAKHFMGDAGSFGCGFIIAESILRGGGLAQPSIALALTAPISIDVAVGLLRRIRLGMSPLAPDQSTCPHHLLKLFRGSIFITTLALWFNAFLFGFLMKWSHAVITQAILYTALLFYLNRHSFTTGRLKNNI